MKILCVLGRLTERFLASIKLGFQRKHMATQQWQVFPVHRLVAGRVLQETSQGRLPGILIECISSLFEHHSVKESAIAARDGRRDGVPVGATDIRADGIANPLGMPCRHIVHVGDFCLAGLK